MNSSVLPSVLIIHAVIQKFVSTLDTTDHKRLDYVVIDHNPTKKTNSVSVLHIIMKKKKALGLVTYRSGVSAHQRLASLEFYAMLRPPHWRVSLARKDTTPSVNIRNCIAKRRSHTSGQLLIGGTIYQHILLGEICAGLVAVSSF